MRSVADAVSDHFGRVERPDKSFGTLLASSHWVTRNANFRPADLYQAKVNGEIEMAAASGVPFLSREYGELNPHHKYVC